MKVFKYTPTQAPNLVEMPLTTPTEEKSLGLNPTEALPNSQDMLSQDGGSQANENSHLIDFIERRRNKKKQESAGVGVSWDKKAYALKVYRFQMNIREEEGLLGGVLDLTV